MKKIIALLLVLCMGVCLVACGSNNGASNDPDYKQQKVTYKKSFEVTCINDEVVCDKDSLKKEDDLVLTLEVKNIGDKAQRFSSIANMNATQGKKTIYPGSLKDKKGKPIIYQANKVIKKGKTATIKYDWKLDNHKDDVVVKFNAFLAGNDAGKMTFEIEDRQTEENAKYEKESKKEYESKSKIKKVDLKTVKVSIPKGWIANNTSKSYTSIEKITDGPIEVVSISAPSVKVKNIKTEAKKYKKNFHDKKMKFYGFEPTSTQFYLFGKAANGKRIEISGVGLSYKEAKKVIDKSVKIK